MPCSQFRYAAKLECYWRAEQKLALCNRFLGSVIVEPPFERITKRIARDMWSAGITADELERFAWVEPQVEVQVRFIEWTKAGVLRQAALS